MTDLPINKIVCGDNVATMATFPAELIDLVVTSPPYDNLRTYGGHTWDFEGVAQELWRVIKPGGVVVWVVADATVNGSETGTDCGGPSCPDCAVGQGCTLNQDCISSSCINSVCACSPDLQPSNDGSGVNGAVGLPSLVMSEIDPGAYIELFNTTNSPIALANTNEWLCSPFVYDKLSTLAPNVTVPARGYAIIPWPAAFTDPSNAGGEMMLYSSASFGTNTDILDFICWGTYVNTRKFQAEAVGKWQGPCDSALSNGVIQRNPNSAGISAAHYSTALPPTPMNCAP